MAHIQSTYARLWKPQNLNTDKIDSQKMFYDNIDALEAFALSVLKKSHAPVDSLTALKAIDTSDTLVYISGMTITVKSSGLYFFDRNRTDSDNGTTIIAPSTGGGRWISDHVFFGQLAFKDSLTKSDIGLGNVPNVATNDQTPTYTQASLLANLVSGEKVSTSFGKIMKAIADLISHLANKSNPHGVTKSQVGLGSVDNTSDASKPVSTAQATAIADAKKAGTDAQTNLSAHTSSTNNPHSVTKTQVGLGNVDNTSDASKPVSTAQATAIADAKKAGTDAQTSLGAHLADTGNPHSVTKSQVGLGNVDNTSDANKPVSTAQATAIADAKKAGTDAQTNLNTHTSNTSNPHSVTKAQVGLGNVPNVSTNDQTPTYTQASSLTNIVSGEKMSTSFGKFMKAIADLILHLGSTSNPHSVTKTQIGLGNVDNTTDTNKPVSTAQATAIADAKKAGTDAQTSINTHTSNKSNPHGVTKSQVGLGNVDNTSDANKPISTAVQTALDGKANIVNGEVPTASYLRLTGFSLLQNTDLNTVKYTGQYGVMSSCTNRPVNHEYGILEVIMYSSHWLVQRYYTVSSSGGTISGVYYRSYYADSTWSAWKYYNMGAGSAMATAEVI